MSIKKILAPMLFGAPGAGALAPALTVAEKISAHLVGLHIRPSPMQQAPYVYPPFVISYVTETSGEFAQQCDDRAQELRNAFDETCAKRKVPVILPSEHDPVKGASASWRDEKGALPYDYGCWARVSDLTVMAALGEGASSEDMAYAEEIVFQSGAPVLFATAENLQEYPEAAIIAWNGGLESSRALRAAIPLLQLMRQTTVLTIGDVAPGSPTPEQAADFLQMHGVHSAHETLSASGKRAEDLLSAAVGNKGAGLVVMGAYSHNRWREAVLGGFTRHMLRQSAIPVLMAH